LKHVLITGGAGFIGSSLALDLLKSGIQVTSFDNFNDFYDPNIKRNNIKRCVAFDGFTSVEGDIRDMDALQQVLQRGVDCVVHLAAMAGVRPSIADPALYYDVNIQGTFNVLEACRIQSIQKIVLASSSSVYGNNQKVPFLETDNVDHPISPYAATKKMNEIMAYNFHHLYNMSICCCRFFTVYGPYQRPEMAIYKFTKAIINQEPIPVFNHGNCERDYTYIDDIVHGIQQIMATDYAFEVVNLGESQTISTNDLIALIEDHVGKKAVKELLPAQPGDVERTFADISFARERFGYAPSTQIEQGIERFVQWFTKQFR
jgi:UDP-glucuronate 4-epimerase